MNRRGFFKRIGEAAAVAVVAPEALKAMPAAPVAVVPSEPMPVPNYWGRHTMVCSTVATVAYESYYESSLATPVIRWDNGSDGE